MSIKTKIEKVLEEKIRPVLERDGGSVELVDVDDTTGTVKVSFVGACAGCPMSKLGTLNFIRETLKAEVPEVKEVEAI